MVWSFPEDLTGSFYWRLGLIAFVVQGFLGVVAFEWAYKRTERVRLAEEEMMQEFPSFRRLDAHLWSRKKFYPGCFLLLLPRTVLVFACVFFVGACQRLLFWGQDMSVPLEGRRRSLHKRLLWCVVPLAILSFGYKLKLTDHDETQVDYSKYLGPDWRNEKFQGKRPSTIISNHIGFIEILAYIALMTTPPSFTPSHHVKYFPIGDHFVRSLNSIYVDRTDNKEKRDSLVRELGNRQRTIETDNDRDWGPLCLFAEGSVTNGQNISRFRRGGFASGVPVQPIVFRYLYQTVSPDYAIVRGLELGFLMLSEFALNVFDAHRYPIFVPNDYLYTEYAKTISNNNPNKHHHQQQQKQPPPPVPMQKWEIYAHAVADLMRREGGFGVNEQALREKVGLQKFVWGEKDEISVNGKTFYWPSRERNNDARDGSSSSAAKKTI